MNHSFQEHCRGTHNAASVVQTGTKDQPSLTTIVHQTGSRPRMVSPTVHRLTSPLRTLAAVLFVAILCAGIIPTAMAHSLAPHSDATALNNDPMVAHPTETGLLAYASLTGALVRTSEPRALAHATETHTFITQNDALQRAIELRDAFRDEEALEAFKQVLRTDRRNYQALYNVVIINTSLGPRESRAADEQARYEEAHEHARQLLAAYPDSAGSHFAYAAAIGRIAQSAGARDRVRMSTEIRESAEKAVELDPQHARAWNVLGVWHHRAANLSRLERLAANALFGGAPEGASNDAARAAFERAMAIDPDFILFYHDKAEFLITIGETSEARRVINQGLRLQERTSDDERWKANMREMQGRL